MSAVNINQSNFQELVLNSDRKVLLDFWAPWCGPCRMVVPLVEAIAEERPDVLVGKVNVDENPDLASQFGVMTIPTLVVMQDGQELQDLLPHLEALTEHPSAAVAEHAEWAIQRIKMKHV